MGEDDAVRSLARYHRHADEDAIAARDLLRLNRNDFLVRFAEVAAFAKTFGLNIRSLAEFMAETGTGMEPWERPFELSREDYERVLAAEERLAERGDWLHTILALLDEADGPPEQRSLNRPGSDDVVS